MNPGGEIMACNTVYQEFITDLLRDDVVPREWLHQRIDEALAEDCRFILVTGHSGMGKTVFMAQLAQRFPTACRYFIRRDGAQPLSGGGAAGFLLAVGHQLAAIHPQLFTLTGVRAEAIQQVQTVQSDGRVVGVAVDELVASPFHETAIRVEQHIGATAGDVVGMAVGRFVADARLLDVTTLERLALIDPARLAVALGLPQQVIVLIDAVDEARFGIRSTNVLDWLSDCPELPPNMRIIVTSRPDDELLESFVRRQRTWLREIRLAEQPEQCQRDVTRYLEVALTDDDRAAIEDEREQLSLRAAGNFQYAATVVRALRGEQAPVAGLLNFVELPADLAGLYVLFISLCRDQVPDRSTWLSVHQPLLGLLAVAAEPVTRDQLRTFLGGTSIRVVNAALALLGQFIHHRSGRYRLYHDSFALFLTSPTTAEQHPDAYLDPREWHAQIVARGRTGAPAWADVDWQKCDDYTVRHVVFHAVGALGDEPVAVAFEVLSGKLIRERLDRFGSHLITSDDAIKLADAALEREEPSGYAAAMLLYSLVRRPANQVPYAVLESLVLQDKALQALDVVDLHEDVRYRIAMFLRLGDLLVARGEQDAARNCVARALSAGSDFAWSETDDIDTLNDWDLDEQTDALAVFRVARAMTDIAVLASRLSDSTDVVQSLNRALRTNDEKFDAQRMGTVATRLAMSGRYDLAEPAIELAVDMALRIEGELVAELYDRQAEIAALQGKQQEARDALDAITDPTLRDQALVQTVAGAARGPDPRWAFTLLSDFSDPTRVLAALPKLGKAAAENPRWVPTAADVDQFRALFGPSGYLDDRDNAAAVASMTAAGSPEQLCDLLDSIPSLTTHITAALAAYHTVRVRGRPRTHRRDLLQRLVRLATEAGGPGWIEYPLATPAELGQTTGHFLPYMPDLVAQLVRALADEGMSEICLQSVQTLQDPYRQGELLDFLARRLLAAGHFGAGVEAMRFLDRLYQLQLIVDTFDRPSDEFAGTGFAPFVELLSSYMLDIAPEPTVRTAELAGCGYILAGQVPKGAMLIDALPGGFARTRLIAALLAAGLPKDADQRWSLTRQALEQSFWIEEIPALAELGTHANAALTKSGIPFEPSLMRPFFAAGDGSANAGNMPETALRLVSALAVWGQDESAAQATAEADGDIADRVEDVLARSAGSWPQNAREVAGTLSTGQWYAVRLRLRCLLALIAANDEPQLVRDRVARVERLAHIYRYTDDGELNAEIALALGAHGLVDLAAELAVQIDDLGLAVAALARLAQLAAPTDRARAKALLGLAEEITQNVPDFWDQPRVVYISQGMDFLGQVVLSKARNEIALLAPRVAVAGRSAAPELVESVVEHARSVSPGPDSVDTLTRAAEALEAIGVPREAVALREDCYEQLDYLTPSLESSYYTAVRRLCQQACANDTELPTLLGVWYRIVARSAVQSPDHVLAACAATIPLIQAASPVTALTWLIGWSCDCVSWFHRDSTAAQTAA